MLNLHQPKIQILEVKDPKFKFMRKSDKIIEKLEDEFQDIKQISEHSLKKLWLNKYDDVWNQYLNEI